MYIRERKNMDILLPLNQFRKALEKYVIFNEDEWDLFISYLSFSTLKKKEHFVKEGKVCSDMGFIVSGSMRHYHLKDGEEVTGYFSFENEFTSSLKSYLTRQPACNYVQALEDTTLILISYQQMQKMLSTPLLAYKMERFGRLLAEYVLICYEDRMTSFITQTPEERYLKMIETSGEIFQRIPQHYIANFLGITPVSLSRIKKRILHIH